MGYRAEGVHADAVLCLAGEAREAFVVGGAGDAPLGDDGVHIAGRRDVEGGVGRPHANWRQAAPADLGDLGLGSLLDRDLLPAAQAEVQSGDRRAT